MKYRHFLLSFALSAGLFAADSVIQQARKNVADKKYDEAITQLEAANKGKPNPETKKALAETYLAKGDAFMTDDSAPPRVKYPTALRAYRDVLRYDKENKKAQQGIATIEGIYKSMGRPIPQ